MTFYLRSPFHFDLGGRTAAADLDAHVRALIDAVLMTAPGERVNRPSFGAGLHAAVFSPAADDLFTAARFLVEGALQRWLGDLVEVDEVEVAGEDAALRVTVIYRVRRSGEARTAVYTREGGA
ncbi:MAG: GPW/gp25 family protein [Nannocystaceae bacterium]